MVPLFTLLTLKKAQTRESRERKIKAAEDYNFDGRDVAIFFSFLRTSS